jgi:hypothetical protein
MGIFFGAAIVFCATLALAQQKSAPPHADTNPEWLPTGQAITPAATPGSSFQTLKPDLPGRKNRFADDAVSNAVSPDGNTLLVLTSGYYLWKNAAGRADQAASTEYVFVFDISHGAPHQLQTIPVARTFGGIIWNPNGQEFYVTGGPDDVVHSYAKFNDSWSEFGTPIPLGHAAGLGLQLKPMPAGVDVTANGQRLVVANYENDSISVVDLGTRKNTGDLDLRPGKVDPTKAGVPGGEFPYGVAVMGDDRAYVASVRDREVVVVNLNPKPAVAARIPEHVPRHSLTARMFHWIMAASMFVLLFTAFLPKVGVQFPWVTYHWIAGVLLTASILFHIIHASFFMDFWAIWPDRIDLRDAWRRMMRFAGKPEPPPDKFAK